MLIVLLIITAAAAGAPIAACVLVSLASTREDSAGTLSEPAAGPLDSWARRILEFHTDAPNCFPHSRGRRLSHPATREADTRDVADDALDTPDDKWSDDHKRSRSLRPGVAAKYGSPSHGATICETWHPGCSSPGAAHPNGTPNRPLRI